MADTGVTINSLKTELALVRTAMQGILKAGQSYSRSGLSVQKVPYERLEKREQYLVRQIARGGTGVVSASQIGPNSQENADNDNLWERG